jgi:hypothetical protein
VYILCRWTDGWLELMSSETHPLPFTFSDVLNRMITMDSTETCKRRMPLQTCQHKYISHRKYFVNTDNFMAWYSCDVLSKKIFNNINNIKVSGTGSIHLGVDVRIILFWIFREYSVKVWSGFRWLRIGCSSRFLWTWSWIFGLNKRWELFKLDEWLSVSREGIHGTG